MSDKHTILLRMLFPGAGKSEAGRYFFIHGYFRLALTVRPIAQLPCRSDVRPPARYFFSPILQTLNEPRIHRWREQRLLPAVQKATALFSLSGDA